jgi:predicted transglutaminase-like cysteine proteinase
MNRNMHECQERARDMITPGTENDPSKMAKVENALIACMSQQVNEHIKLLQPMKERITAALKNYK